MTQEQEKEKKKKRILERNNVKKYLTLADDILRGQDGGKKERKCDKRKNKTENLSKNNEKLKKKKLNDPVEQPERRSR